MSNSDQQCLDDLNPCHILKLNDDCFYRMYDFLPTIDWCSLRETCTRFRTISDYCFQRQSESFLLNANNIYGTYDLLTLEDIKPVIRNFGKFLTKLTINQNDFKGYDNAGKLLPLVDRYCRALQDLKLVKVTLPAATIAQCSRLLSNVHRLAIDQWIESEETFDLCLASCVTLKELELIRLENIEGKNLAQKCFASLESFSMKCCNGFNFRFLKQFFVSNCQLRRVKLLKQLFPAHNVMGVIAASLPNLVELSVQYSVTFLSNFAAISHLPLRKFEIDCILNARETSVKQLFTGLAARNSMEDLHVAYFDLNDVSVLHLCAFKTLTILKLTATNHLDKKICKKLATELPALSEVHIVECEHATFNEIKEFVVHTANLKTIVFNRTDDERPSLTKDTFLSLVAVRKNRMLKEILFIYLNDNDLDDIQYELDWSGMSKILIQQANYIRLLPLEKEHRRTVFEYGSCFSKLKDRTIPHLHSEEISDDDSDDDFYDNFDDHFDEY